MKMSDNSLNNMNKYHAFYFRNKNCSRNRKKDVFEEDKFELYEIIREKEKHEELRNLEVRKFDSGKHKFSFRIPENE